MSVSNDVTYSATYFSNIRNTDDVRLTDDVVVRYVRQMALIIEYNRGIYIP
jgi:hypothetical protein